MTTSILASHDGDLPPVTHGCMPALLLNSPAVTKSTSTVAANAVASAGGADGATSGVDAAGGGIMMPASTVFVHPIVLLSVLDHHNRRQEGAGRVIGTLLGKRDGDRVRGRDDGGERTLVVGIFFVSSEWGRGGEGDRCVLGSR
jgi:hypothetical protein